jgi:putative PEP-CTERM system histidine kinase
MVPGRSMIDFLFLLNLALLVSCLSDLRRAAAEKLFSYAVIRALLMLPLLAGEYVWFAYHTGPRVGGMVIFSEAVLALAWAIAALRIGQASSTVAASSRLPSLAGACGAVILAALGLYLHLAPPELFSAEGVLVLPYYGYNYVFCLVTLVAMLLMAWRLEGFWRVLPPRSRWEYKYLVIGLLLATVSIGWATSYRLAYLRLVSSHFLLLAILLSVAWLFMFYAVTRHRLLNRRIFVSRKMVYSFVAPVAFAGYLIAVGIVSLLTRAFGWTVPFILQWLLIVGGLLGVVVLAASSDVRNRVKYFISTNFYVNKYEYRDEWLDFSSLLRGALSEAEVVSALREVLSRSLYTKRILIWTGDSGKSYRLVTRMGSGDPPGESLDGGDLLVSYLDSRSYLYLENPRNDAEAREVIAARKEFFTASGIVLLVRLTIGERCVGLVGLGPEFTGGRYGEDDFDLLVALATQAASSLLAVRTAEELAQAREKGAWDTLSAFVLHDIKNASTTLSLIKDNAGEHMHKPEFQQDLLKSLDDALGRMAKVQTRLHTLKGEITPVLQKVDLSRLIGESAGRMGKNVPGLSVAVECPAPLPVETDPEMLSRVLENLLINSVEACSGGAAVVRIAAGNSESGDVEIRLTDSGPGIPPELLPDLLFYPFRTSKKKATGIGLWQAQHLVRSLNGTVKAENLSEGGACFTVRLPVLPAS